VCDFSISTIDNYLMEDLFCNGFGFGFGFGVGFGFVTLLIGYCYCWALYTNIIFDPMNYIFYASVSKWEIQWKDTTLQQDMHCRRVCTHAKMIKLL
jgi:hypothetical protein